VVFNFIPAHVILRMFLFTISYDKVKTEINKSYVGLRGHSACRNS